MSRKPTSIFFFFFLQKKYERWATGNRSCITYDPFFAPHPGTPPRQRSNGKSVQDVSHPHRPMPLQRRLFHSVHLTRVTGQIQEAPSDTAATVGFDYQYEGRTRPGAPSRRSLHDHQALALAQASVVVVVVVVVVRCPHPWRHHRRHLRCQRQL